ncbi:MAG: serine hydrolase [Saprospiraceae bacterium]|nr:serine hydrolase [Saprospiraceae bacterium]
MDRILSTIMTALCLGLLSIPTIIAQSKDEISSVILEFRNQIEQEVEADNNKGSITITVLKGKHTLWSGAYGFADFTNAIKADSSKIYRTGSISKTFTAFLMMQLVDEGTIQLTDPVEQYLPEIAALKGYGDSTKITFHHLASHTSGLIREPKLENAAAGPIAHWEEKVLASIPETSFKSGMDQAYSYSNIAFGILGLALSRAAAKPFMQLVEEKIFQPLQMNNSFFIVPASKMGDLAIGMQSNGMGQVHEAAAREHQGRGYKVPNGGIYSTPNDLMKFMNAIMGYDGLLKQESLSAMLQGQTPKDNYGYGISLFEDSEISTAGHGGSVAGYNCYMLFDKESQYGVVLMRNYNRGKTNLGRVSRELIRKLKSRE